MGKHSRRVLRCLEGLQPLELRKTTRFEMAGREVLAWGVRGGRGERRLLTALTKDLSVMVDRTGQRSCTAGDGGAIGREGGRKEEE